MASDHQLHLLDMPEEIIEIIISYLSYHESSESRRVCKMFNKLCQQRLNRGFARVDKLHAQIQKEVKNKLPRRESERRSHQLARHVDILSAIETRLSLLGMSYMKYMDSGLCCFIPGKVLDELVMILYKLQSSDQPPRSHEFLQELRDISSMAMEHFDEKIVPILKTRLPAVTLPYPFTESCTGASTSSATTLFPFQASPIRIRTEISHFGSQLRAQSTNMQQFKKDMTEVRIGYTNNKKKVTEQEKKIVQQSLVIAELEKKVSDLNQKFLDMSAELQKLKEVQEGGGESSNTISHLPKEKYSKGDNSEKKVQTETKERVTRNKGLKRKHGGQYESRVKKSRS